MSLEKYYLYDNIKILSSIFYNKVTKSHYVEQMFLYYLINI